MFPAHFSKAFKITGLSVIVIAALAGCSSEATPAPATADSKVGSAPVQVTAAPGEVSEVEDNTDVFVGTPAEEVEAIVVALDTLYVEVTKPEIIAQVEDIRSKDAENKDELVLTTYENAKTFLKSGEATTAADELKILDKIAGLKEFEEDGKAIDFVQEENVVVKDDTAIATVGTKESGTWDINLVQEENVWFIDVVSTNANGAAE